MDDLLVKQVSALCGRNFFSVCFENNLKTNGTLIVFHGKTCVHCSIYGPKPTTFRYQEKACLNVELKIKGDPNLNEDKLQFIQETAEKLLAKIIKVDEYPFTNLTINMTIMNNAGSLLSAVINACMLCPVYPSDAAYALL